MKRLLIRNGAVYCGHCERPYNAEHVCSAKTGRQITYRLPNGLLYEVDEEQGHSQSIFPDGTCCNAVWGVTGEDEERARQLGYAGSRDAVTSAMGRDHDLIHHLVAHAEGWPWSQTLWLLAHDMEVPPGVGKREERLVFLVTRALNMGGLLPEALLP